MNMIYINATKVEITFQTKKDVFVQLCGHV